MLNCSTRPSSPGEASICYLQQKYHLEYSARHSTWGQMMTFYKQIQLWMNPLKKGSFQRRSRSESHSQAACKCPLPSTPLQTISTRLPPLQSPGTEPSHSATGQTLTARSHPPNSYASKRLRSASLLLTETEGIQFSRS